MRTCLNKYCNKSINNEWSVCPRCGSEEFKGGYIYPGKVCNECGKEMSKDFLFCPWCGKQYYEKEERYHNKAKGFTLDAECNECGDLIPNYVSFCPWCGVELNNKDEVCLSCDHGMSDYWYFCVWCGEERDWYENEDRDYLRFRIYDALEVINCKNRKKIKIRYNDGTLDSFVYPKSLTANIGVNMHQKYLTIFKRNPIYNFLLPHWAIHEVGHVIFNIYEGQLRKKYLDLFCKHFRWDWGKYDSNEYETGIDRADMINIGLEKLHMKKQRKDFVTVYAEKSPDEDFAETFVIYLRYYGNMNKLSSKLKEFGYGRKVFRKLEVIDKLFE